jgi:hypothetical protein
MGDASEWSPKYTIAIVVVLIFIILFYIMNNTRKDPYDCGCGCDGTKMRLNANWMSGFKPTGGAPQLPPNKLQPNASNYPSMQPLMTGLTANGQFPQKAKYTPKKVINKHKDMQFSEERKAHYVGYPKVNDFQLVN